MNLRIALQPWCLALSLFFPVLGQTAALNSVEYPELSEIQTLSAQTRPAGVVFNVMEDDEEALEWVLPRLQAYVNLLRQSFPDLEIAVVSHGDEIRALPNDDVGIYPEIHQLIVDLVESQKVAFHICGAQARMNDLDEDEFPPYIDVVPFGPRQIEDYKAIGFEMVTIDATW